MSSGSLRRKLQRGNAALEFALVLPVMLLILYGLVTFGAAFYTQLAVSRAAEDGARAITFLPEPEDEDEGPDYSLAANEVINSLAASRIVPISIGSSFADRHTWVNENVGTTISVEEGVACDGEAISTRRVSIRVNFPYNDTAGTRMLPSIMLPGLSIFETWMPDTLSACATSQQY